MGQIVSSAAKPKRCNLNKLSQLGTPAAGEHILVSSDNSMNAAGQGNFDRYIVGDGNTAATALPLLKMYENTVETYGKSDAELDIIDSNYNCLARFKNGHIYLAHFNSEELEGLSYEGVVNLIQDKIDGLNAPIVTDDSTLAEIDFCDDSRNVVLRLKNGHIYTGHFNSEDVAATISEYVGIRDKYVDEIMNMKLEDWSDMQFGMFIHWGVYSAWAGHWDGGLDRFGNTVGEFNNGGEWMYRNSKMPESVYKSKQSEFTASNWDTDRLCQLAKSIGMKYIIITARHHDGFALYKSGNEPWNIDTSAAPNDVLMKLKKSCEKYGIKFGLYISTFRNWTEEGGYDQNWTVLPNRDPYTKEQHLAFASKQLEILKELYDTYHPFEFWGDGESAISDDVAKLQNSYMPFVFTNDRGGFHSRFGSVENNIVVYDNICTYKRERCKYFQIAWGYNEGDESYSRLKPFHQELWNMLTALSRGYNILENVGPKADGSLPDAVLTWLGYLRDWCNKYFHFNGCKRIATLSNYPWGRIVNKEDSVYCIIIDGNNTISVDGVDVSNFKGAHVYGISNPDDAANYQIDAENNKIVINNLPTGVTTADPFHVVRLDFNGTPVFMDYFDTNDIVPAKTFIADTVSAETLVEINWNQSSNVRLMNPNSSAASYTPASFSFVTRFRWVGDTDDYSVGTSIEFENMYSPISNAREGITGTQTLRVELYDEYEEEPFFSNEEIRLTDNGDILSSASKVHLTEGQIYKMRVVVSTDATFVAGMAEKINNFSFDK